MPSGGYNLTDYSVIAYKSDIPLTKSDHANYRSFAGDLDTTRALMGYYDTVLNDTVKILARTGLKFFSKIILLKFLIQKTTLCTSSTTQDRL